MARSLEGATKIHLHKLLRDIKNEDNGSNREEDEQKGKVGEEGLRRCLLLLKPHLSLPEIDYELRNGKYLNWTKDLIKLQIKSCGLELDHPDKFKDYDKFNRYGPSWLINAKVMVKTSSVEIDGEWKEEYILRDEEVIVLMVVDIKTGRCKVYGWTTYKDLRELHKRNLFTECYGELPHKRAFFLVDLVELDMVRPIEELRDDQIITGE